MLMTNEQAAETECLIRRILYTMHFTATMQAIDYFCFGRLCPMWRWYDAGNKIVRNEDGADQFIRFKERKGYCGFAGGIIHE